MPVHTLMGAWPPEVDLPQVDRNDPPDHHEAYWAYGYDAASRVGHYLYLAAERDDEVLRRESVFLYLPDGSVLARYGAGRGSRDRIAAGDRLEFECVEPFRRWRGRHAGPMQRLVGDELVTGPSPDTEVVEASVDVEIETVAPPWNTEGDWGERPPSLRYHQFYDARGTIETGGATLPFGGHGFRSHSRRRRGMPGYTGHAIINARFPSGRGFGLLRYRATVDRPERGRGFIYVDAGIHDADVVAWPHLDHAVPSGDPVRIELRAERLRAVITGETIVSPFVTVGAGRRQFGVHADLGPGFVLAPAIARFEWDGEIGYGALERSSLPSAICSHRSAGADASAVTDTE